MDAEELQACLTASGIAGTFKPFSKETCIIMVNMLDDSGKLGYDEFTELLHCLQCWMVRNTFAGGGGGLAYCSVDHNNTS